MGPGTLFAWQHDARPHPPATSVSLFDDGAAPLKLQPQSRRARARARPRAACTPASTPRLHRHSPPLLADALRSQLPALPNGNALVGYGTAAVPDRVRPTGAVVLLDARLPPEGENYRALRFPWVGRPLEPPRLVASAITLAPRPAST